MLEFQYTEDTGFGKLDEGEIDLILRDWLHGIGDFARISFIQHVPVDSGATLDAISESRVNKTAGNFWSVSVGIDPITPREPGESPEYPRFVEEGTGIFGPNAASDVSNAFIIPSHGNVIAFEKSSGETVFTRWVMGQEPQPYLDRVADETNRYIEDTKHLIAAKISALMG